MPRRLTIIGVILAAAVLPLLAFAAIVTPFDRFPGSRRVQFALVGCLDAPVAVFNRVLPEQLRTHATYVVRCSHTYCFPDELHVEAGRYLRAGFPAYMLLFCAPFGVRALMRRLKPSARGDRTSST